MAETRGGSAASRPRRDAGRGRTRAAAERARGEAGKSAGKRGREKAAGGEGEGRRVPSFSLVGPLVLGLFVVATMVVAFLLVPPFMAADLQAFEDPGSVWNSVFYIVLVLVFTLFILAVIRLNRKVLVKAFMAVAVLLTLFYVAFGLLVASGAGGWWPTLGGLSLAVAVTAVLLAFPEWYVIDATGVLVAAGAVALFGVSLSIVPVLVLLVALAAYDAIAVYRTRHMLTLAEGVLDLRMPVLFIVPRHRGYSFRRRPSGSSLDEDRQDALFMGVGDAVIPSILPLSAAAFLPVEAAPPLLGLVNLPALASAAGVLVGFALLMGLARSGRPQAGLPSLNGGAIAGYLLGCLAAGIPPF